MIGFILYRQGSSGEMRGSFEVALSRETCTLKVGEDRCARPGCNDQYCQNKNTLIYKEFIGTVSYSSDDRIFYGKIEGIDDLITFEGTTVEELESAFKFMID